MGKNRIIYYLDWELMVCTADYSIETSLRAPITSFYSAVKYTLAELRKVYGNFATKVHSSFLLCTKMKFQGQPNSSGAVEQLNISHMSLFHYNPRNDN